MVTNNNSGNSGGKYIYFKFWQTITSRMREGIVQTTVLKAIEDYKKGDKSVQDLRDLLIEFCTTEKEDSVLYALLPINNAKEDAIDDAWNELWAANAAKVSSEASASSSVVEAGIDGSDSAAAKKRKKPANDVPKKVEFEPKSDEELMEMLTEANRPGNWNRKKHNKLADLLAKRAFIAAAKDGDIQKLSETSEGVTKAQVLEWMNGSETFKGLQPIILAKWSSGRRFNDFIGFAMKNAGYKKISGSFRYALPEDVVPQKH
jgi:hypothetical protein